MTGYCRNCGNQVCVCDEMAKQAVVGRVELSIPNYEKIVQGIADQSETIARLEAENKRLREALTAKSAKIRELAAQIPYLDTAEEDALLWVDEDSTCGCCDDASKLAWARGLVTRLAGEIRVLRAKGEK